ncbi:MAG: 3-phosphoshikimate 1-carboxyvinyltransferase [Anaerolineae bacterium]|nr:3-phosphoshikimate 1-carboxyvinyltransferase [Anaerolineae bacterium]
MPALLVYPQTTPLRGRVSIPGDKSISHRAIMLGSIAQGTSHIRRWLPAGDTLATLRAMQSLGVLIHLHETEPTAWELTIEGQGMALAGAEGNEEELSPLVINAQNSKLETRNSKLNLRHAGTGIRLLAGLMAGQKFPSVLDGSEQLRRRPMGRIVTPLRQMGANITATDGRAPLFIEPAPLHGIELFMQIASAQVKSAVLLAGLYAEGETIIHEAGPSRDHTERLLAAMGADVQTHGRTVILRPGSPLQAVDLTVPADISSAAFLLVAAACLPHSHLTLNHIGLNPTRTGLLDILGQMGAHIQGENPHLTGGEPVSDLTIRFNELHSTTIAGETVVRAIDEMPIWAVATSQAAGISTVREAGELRVKEVDRIAVLAGELRKMGVNISEQADGFTVTGPTRLNGAEVDSHDDHRLGMSLAIAALLADTPTHIHQAGCIADSFPGFVETMQQVGAKMTWLN